LYGLVGVFDSFYFGLYLLIGDALGVYYYVEGVEDVSISRNDCCNEVSL
jgi:hypothetical protein